ncbi:hypothetical protein [uncultured Sulfitobacter sp.]|uniref:hypothetical protein n=1 Tax=uncultured Sulfitobacter sp. TaxID=191468 RepID=UPI00262FB5A9|nr:hypothetical protein [uncultured Sulfitobacter sp.]
MPEAVSGFLGGRPTGFAHIVGVGLIMNGLYLSEASSRTAIHPVEVVYFALGDLLWWLGSHQLITDGSWITTSSGVIATIVVACGVSGLGIVHPCSFASDPLGATIDMADLASPRLHVRFDLGVIVAACLIMDVYDLWRFLRRDRAVLGSHTDEY